MLSSHMLPTWNEFGLGLANHIWQSTLFMVGVGALTLLFRRNSAAVRYRLWMIASVKFLIPFAVLVGVGGKLDWRPVQVLVPSAMPHVIRQIGQPFIGPSAMTSGLPVSIAAPVAGDAVAVLLTSVWLVGTVSVLLVWCVRWFRIAHVVRCAQPVTVSPPWIRLQSKSPRVRALVSPAGMEPGVFGIFRPVLLIPEDIDRNLHSAQLEPLIAHEMFHVQGRDNLAAAVHTIVEAAFWFHPMVWWLGNRLVDERERACDEAVLQLGFKPADYAEGILAVCKRYVVAPPCMAGVSGSNLKKRIEDIMENRETRDLTLVRKVLLATAGAGIVIVPLLSGVAGMQKAVEAQTVHVFTTQSNLYEKMSATAVAVITRAPAHVQQPSPVQPAVQGGNSQLKWPDDVSGIISDAEKNAFQQLTNDSQRQGFITNFWLVRDPTPGTPANEFKDEYVRRVTYANQHFTTPLGIPGSQTDRGKIYILHGPPDEIVPTPNGGTLLGFSDQNNNFQSNNSLSETWRYRHIDKQGDNLIYQFVDKQKNGEYTLENDSSSKSK